MGKIIINEHQFVMTATAKSDIKQIHDWLEEHEIVYESHGDELTGTGPICDVLWAIPDDQARMLFVLRWGKS